ncbi:MAG: endonuclease/exonuclease/phosphatase family protein [Lewinellaceae bacterium]|nr:endonuclease/exonuclease/phosphatase family protein [Lewinellaceae bacterium]
MPFYRKLDASKPEDKRTIQNLLLLRKDLNLHIPVKKSMDESLLLATWNIREFDSAKYGSRTDESIYYIAEIVARFDLIAIQEIRESLDGLNRLMSLLGPNWDYLFTDVTQGSAGNGERMAFVFDKRKVRHGGLASEMVFPPLKIKGEDGKMKAVDVRQVARTPFMCGFRAGWTDFVLTTVHIYYGEAVAEDPDRIKEIGEIAQFLAKRSEEPRAWSNNWLLLGDFNIFAPTDVTMKAITAANFKVPKELQNLPSNVAQDKYYDQIAFKVREDRFATNSKAGVYNFYKVLYTKEQEAEYLSVMGDAYLNTKENKPRDVKARSRYYRDWRLFQMSDHLPMWVELRIDYSDEYLERKLEPPVV